MTIEVRNARSGMMNDQETQTKIGIYVGKGVSHSWTWFVDILETASFFNICFLDEDLVRDRGLADLQVFLVAGGDTFDLAEGLGERGSQKLADFVGNGGVYIGSCAGAYLMLRSSKEAVNLFNYVLVRIRNHFDECPSLRAEGAYHYPRYRCRDIFHPVRDEVMVRTRAFDPLNGNQELIVPLFGGPIMIPSEDAQTLAIYSGFTARTRFLIHQDMARKTVLNHSAAIRKDHGDGTFFLFGPHFEHPQYPAANKVVLDIIRSAGRNGSRTLEQRPTVDLHGSNRNGTLLREVKGEISNARIVAIALQRYPLSWSIGIKTYEPPKIWHFLEAVWKRVPALFQAPRNHDSARLEIILEQARYVTYVLRSMKAAADRMEDTLDFALRLFPELKRMTAGFLAYHFLGKLHRN